MEAPAVTAPLPLSDRDNYNKSGANRPKRSWKEIDAARDGSRRPAAGEGPKANANAEAKASRDHRAALDALFAKGEIGKYAEKLGLGTPGQKAALDPVKAAASPPPPDPEAEARAEKDAERLVLRKKILEGTSRDTVGRAFDRYTKAYGIPKDWELLERGLEHPRDERLAEVMTEIEVLLGRVKPRRARTIDGRLRLIAETHEDNDLRSRAAAIRSLLA